MALFSLLKVNSVLADNGFCDRDVYRGGSQYTIASTQQFDLRDLSRLFGLDLVLDQSHCTLTFLGRELRDLNRTVQANGYNVTCTESSNVGQQVVVNGLNARQ